VLFIVIFFQGNEGDEVLHGKGGKEAMAVPNLARQRIYTAVVSGRVSVNMVHLQGLASPVSILFKWRTLLSVRSRFLSRMPRIHKAKTVPAWSSATKQQRRLLGRAVYRSLRKPSGRACRVNNLCGVLGIEIPRF